jgi:hypothetical protein
MSKAKAIKLATALNVELDYGQFRYAYYDIAAPKGLKFASNDSHALFAECDTMREMWSSLVEDLSYGLDTCDAANCEFCTK